MWNPHNIQGFNNVPKDYKHITLGVTNFNYTRNRILWTTRKNPSILASTKRLTQLHSYHKKKVSALILLAQLL